MNDETPLTALPDSVLRFAAERAAADPFYFGYSLDVYQRAQQLSDAEIARELKCAERAVYCLYLCGQPEMDDMPRFAQDIQAIAARLQLAPGPLASLARKAASVAAPRPVAANRFVTRSAAYGMAAQDREPGIDPEAGEPESGQP